jgi:hypothetical protein
MHSMHMVACIRSPVSVSMHVAKGKGGRSLILHVRMASPSAPASVPLVCAPAGTHLACCRLVGLDGACAIPWVASVCMLGTYQSSPGVLPDIVLGVWPSSLCTPLLQLGCAHRRSLAHAAAAAAAALCQHAGVRPQATVQRRGFLQSCGCLAAKDRRASPQPQPCQHGRGMYNHFERSWVLSTSAFGVSVSACNERRRQCLLPCLGLLLTSTCNSTTAGETPHDHDREDPGSTQRQWPGPSGRQHLDERRQAADT